MIRFSMGESNEDKADGKWIAPETFKLASFSGLLDLLEEFYPDVREPWTKDGVCLLPDGMDPVEPSTPWFSAFLLNGRSRRRKCDVIGMGSFVTADKDNGNRSLDLMRAALPDTPCCFYTTTKSRSYAQRWRIVAETDREHSAVEFDSLFRYLQERFDGLDHQTNHCNRIQFVPAHWTSADNQFARFDNGTPLCVDEIVAAYPPPPEPDPIPVADLSNPPTAMQIITDAMLAEVLGQPEGGRMWRLLCAAAARCKYYGWVLTDHELANAGEAANTILSPRKTRHGLSREAGRAIQWANGSVETMPRIPNNFFYTGYYDVRKTTQHD